MLARTVIYHDEYRGPLAMLVTKVQEDGTLDGTLFPDGSMRGEPVQGVSMAKDPELAGPGTCTDPYADMQKAMDLLREDGGFAKDNLHKTDLAANRSLEHQHKAEAAADRAEAAATRAEAAAKPAPKTTKGTSAKK